MRIVYRFDNPEDMEQLEAGKEYTTQVVDATWEGNSMVIVLHFVGETYNPNDPQCLFPVKKEHLNED